MEDRSLIPLDKRFYTFQSLPILLVLLWTHDSVSLQTHTNTRAPTWTSHFFLLLCKGEAWVILFLVFWQTTEVMVYLCRNVNAAASKTNAPSVLIMDNGGDCGWFWRAACFVFTRFIVLTLVLCGKTREKQSRRPLHSFCSAKTMLHITLALEWCYRRAIVHCRFISALKKSVDYPFAYSLHRQELL